MGSHQVLAFTLGASQDRMLVSDAEGATCEQAGRAVPDVVWALATDLQSVDAVDGETGRGLVAREDGHVVWTHPEPISVEI